MLEVSQHTVGSIYRNTPLKQALLEDGPQFKTHSAWLVNLELGNLQNPGQTASLSPTFCWNHNRKKLHHTKL
jgi:hypothetical protein